MMTVILESALRTAITAALVWSALRLFRVTHVVAQKIAWCLVLVAAFAMPSIMGWRIIKLPAPLVLRTNWLRGRQPVAQMLPESIGITKATAITLTPPKGTGYAPSNSRSHIIRLYSFAAVSYFTICSILLLRMLIGLALAVRVWRRAQPVNGCLMSRPKVRSSYQVSTPCTIGFSIVLPSSFGTWGPARLKMVLAHERSHVVQADFYLQLLARLHAVFFWFSPVAWWLQQELSDLGEAISDHAAIEEAPDKHSYAEVLLQFAAMVRRPLVGIAMARSTKIDRRIDRILIDARYQRAFLHGKAHAVAAAAIVPLALLASTSFVVVRAADNVALPLYRFAATNQPSSTRSGELRQRAQLSLPVPPAQISKKQVVQDLPAPSDRSEDESPKTLADNQSELAEQANSGEQPAAADQSASYQINLSWPPNAAQQNDRSSQNLGVSPYTAGTFGPIKLGPSIIYAPHPRYSEEERKRCKNAPEGGCVVALIVDEKGMPQEVHVIRHFGVEFDRTAVRSVEQFRFLPATSNGKPVPASLTIEVLAARRPQYRVTITNIE
jgi:outer membrane biosynthesis protein TonB